MKHCPNCGNLVDETVGYCPSCGTQLVVPQNPQMMNGQNPQYEQVDPSLQKSKMVAGLLAIFAGTLGVHNFYLGYTTKGVIQLCLTVFGWIICVGPIIAEVWGIAEAVMIFTGSISTDSNGVKLKN